MIVSRRSATVSSMTDSSSLASERKERTSSTERRNRSMIQYVSSVSRARPIPSSVSEHPCTSRGRGAHEPRTFRPLRWRWPAPRRAHPRSRRSPRTGSALLDEVDRPEVPVFRRHGRSVIKQVTSSTPSASSSRVCDNVVMSSFPVDSERDGAQFDRPGQVVAELAGRLLPV